MFTADPSITDLKVLEKGVFKVLFSMDIHQVATPDTSVEDARCFFLFFREGTRFAAHAALITTRTNRTFYYSHSANPFSEDALAGVEDDARQFAEDMGFVLDAIGFAGMSIEQRNAWLEEQGLLGRKKEAPQEAKVIKPLKPSDTPSPRPTSAVIRPAPAAPAPSPDAMEQRVKAGIVKPPRTAPREGPAATSVVPREREPLARLLASF